MDPQQQHIANMMTGMGAGIILFAILIGLAFAIFFVFLFWRIFVKAGLAGPLALLVIVPFGVLVVLCILAFANWNVVPAQPPYGTLPPNYPPPYPPAPPATPSQL
jgi:hypothetical protein